jgi:arylsulfatase A-like enzyme
MAQVSVRSGALLLFGCAAGCRTEMVEKAPARPAAASSFSVDLGAELSLPPNLLQPGAVPGVLSLQGTANTETDPDGDTYTWQAAEELVMEIDVAGKARPHELRIRAQPFPLPDGSPQSITPIVNGEALPTQRVTTHREELNWTVPADAMRAGNNKLVLRAGYAVAPADVKAGAKDKRTLAYRIYGMSFAAAGRQGPSGGLVELVPKVPVSLPVEGADSLQLVLDRATLSGDAPLRLNITLSVDGPPTLDHAYRKVESVVFTEEETQNVSVALPLEAGEAAMLQLEAEASSGASLLVSGLKLAGTGTTSAVSLAAPTVKPPPLVVLYVSDTTRADRLSLFDYARPTTPNLEAMVESGTEAWVAHSNSSWTRPSIATLFTGLEQGAHGVQTKWDALPADIPLLATSLRDAGYRTVAFSGSSHVQEGSGFSRGFTRFVDVSEPRVETDLKPRIVHYMDEVFEEIDQSSDRPLFLFIHSIGPHDPYQAPKAAQAAVNLPPIPTVYGEDLAEGPAQIRWIELAFRDRIDMNGALVGGLSALYDAEIYDEDAQIGHFVDGLKQRGLWDHSLFVLTSDHGEEFGEHGSLRHGRTLWDEQLRVPLLIHWPEGVRPPHASTAGLLDIPPTILSMAGADPIPGAQGRDLRTDPPPPRYWHAEVGAEKLSALWDDRYKLVVQGGRDPFLGLYDRHTDPGEHHNVWASHPARVSLMMAAMEQQHQTNAELRRGHRVEASQLTETQEDRLRLLGYVDEDQ